MIYSHLERVLKLCQSTLLALNGTMSESLDERHNYCVKGKNLSESERLKYSTYYMPFNQHKWITKLFDPLINNPNPSLTTLTEYLRYISFFFNNSNQVQNNCLTLINRFSSNSWCELLTKTYPIKIKILEKNELSTLYCTKCLSKN